MGAVFTELSIEKDESLWDLFIQNIVNAIEGRPAEIIDFNQGYEVQVVLEALRNPQPMKI